MSVYIIHQQMLPAPELIEAMTGSPVVIGSLVQVPVKLILDNQSSSDVVLSIDVGGGPIQWKTFTAGEALILDDDIYSFPRGTTFTADGGGTGNFSISYTYINQP